MLPFYRFAHFKKYDTLLHAISTKITQMPYAFSLALHTGEEERSIVANRNILAKALESSSPLHFIVANQTHSDHIKIIDNSVSRGWKSNLDAIEDCDALITNLSNVVLTILTADCVPILLYDPVQQVVAAVHAGWKGSKAQIVKKTVRKMIHTFDTNPTDIQVGIAPSIGACCYEVGEDVAKYFFDTPLAYKQKEEKYMLNLPYVNKQQLLECGVKESHIEMSHICTACNVEHYFSYRKEQGCSGRFMSMIALNYSIKNRTL